MAVPIAAPTGNSAASGLPLATLVGSICKGRILLVSVVYVNAFTLKTLILMPEQDVRIT